MLVIFLFTLLGFQEELLKESLSLSELDSFYPMTATANQDKVFFAYLKGLNTVLCVYDFKSTRVTKITDQRFRLQSPVALAYKDAFAIITFRHKPAVYFLNADLNIEDTVSLDDFTNFRADISWLIGSPHGENQLLINGLDREKGIVHLVRINVQERTFTYLAKMERDKETPAYWVSNGRDTFLFEGSTSRIDLVDSETFKPIKILRGAREPVLKKKQRPRRTKYMGMINFPFISGDQIQFRHHEFRTNAGDIDYEAETKILTISPEGIHESKYHLLGAYQGQQLVFDYDWKELLVKQVAD